MEFLYFRWAFRRAFDFGFFSLDGLRGVGVSLSEVNRGIRCISVVKLGGFLCLGAEKNLGIMLKLKENVSVVFFPCEIRNCLCVMGN